MRSMADVKSMIAHAKLNEKNLTETTQTLYFAASTDETDYKLLELNSHILSAIENGEDLYFKGRRPNLHRRSRQNILATYVH